jgi:Na+/H+ antiporter NhaD/arsenite permease-like protein
MTFAHWLALGAFAVTYAGMALGRLPGLALDRTGIAMCAAIAVVAGGAMSATDVPAAIDASTLAILFGLMIVSAMFGIAGLFDWCAARIGGATASPPVLLALTVAVAGGLSALLANDVVVFAMTPMLCRGIAARGLDPRPFLIGLAGAANAGSAATLVGNPQNILIAETGRLDFGDFLAVCGPPALLSLVLVYAAVRWVFAAELRVRPLPAAAPLPPLDHALLLKTGVATIVLVALYLAGAPRALATLGVAALLLVSRRVETRGALARVDWSLILLFGALFVVNAAFAGTGLCAGAVAWLGAAGLAPDRLAVLVPLGLVLSNTIGNVPAVVMILALWPDLGPAALTGLALFSTLAGNLLIVGSLANIIVVQRAAEAGTVLRFRDHARAGIPMTLASMAAAALWLATTGALGW